MSLTVCPAAFVAAPVEVVWGNLVQWERYSEWFSADVQVERSEPEGPATVGQTISFAGKVFVSTLHFTFKVEEVHPARHPRPACFFPAGLANETTHLLHSHRRDHLSRPIWLRLHLPPRLVGLVPRHIWRETIRCQHRRFLAAPQACLFLGWCGSLRFFERRCFIVCARRRRGWLRFGGLWCFNWWCDFRGWCWFGSRQLC